MGRFQKFGLFVSLSVLGAGLQAAQIRFEDLGDYFAKSIGHPLLWGQELVGADYAKEELRGLSLDPVHVVVSDSGILGRNIPKIKFLNSDEDPYIGNLARFTKSSVFVPEKLSSHLEKMSQDPRWKKKLSTMELDMHSDHGTHVAGLISSENFGGTEEASLEDLDIFEGLNFNIGYERMLAAYIQLVSRPQPTEILSASHSIEGGAIVFILKALIASKGSLCVIAAGNTGEPIDEHSNLNQLKDNTVVVGAYGISGGLMPFSSYGNRMDLIAPGEEIISDGRDLPLSFHGESVLTSMMTGTSMATPMVTAALTNLKSILPQASANDLIQILLRTSFDLGATGKDLRTGAGLLNSYRAILVAKRILKYTEVQTAEEIHRALEDKNIYDTSSIANEITDPQLLRKKILAAGKTEGLDALGQFYIQNGFLKYGMGLRFAALNRLEAQPSDVELDEVAADLVDTLHRLSGAQLHFSDQIENIVRVDLLTKVSAQIESSDFAPLTKTLFELRLKKQSELLENNLAKAAGVRLKTLQTSNDGQAEFADKAK